MPWARGETTARAGAARTIWGCGEALRLTNGHHMLIFWAIAAVSLTLLLLTVIIGDFLDGIFDSLDFTGGYLSSATVLTFLSTFGLTGAILLSSTEASTLFASLGGAVAGVAVGAGGGLVVKALSDGPTTHQISVADYINRPATVTIPIPPGGLGEVRLIVAGRSQTLAARADGPVPSGTSVTIEANLAPGTVRVTLVT